MGRGYVRKPLNCLKMFLKERLNLEEFSDL